MKVNDLLHGFRVKSVTELKEIEAKMWRMEYEKNGAGLIWFEREDINGNMTFDIGFKTIPDDDTGVFHIIEHSVLCGSEKYPLKDVFGNLGKVSVATDCNADTSHFWTDYYFCSRNNKDLLNLMDVYLDAVFHSLLTKSDLAFRNEGWHWEIDEKGEPKINGIVYNEMKGAYDSKDYILDMETMRCLFPDNCYSKASGGNPESIPNLTYEKYLSSYRKYYSASNALILLDGMIDTDAVLSKLDEYLSEFDRTEVNAEILFQKPVEVPEKIIYYPIGEEDETAGKTMLIKSWAPWNFLEYEKRMAAVFVFFALCGNNESPVKKAVIDSGLAENVRMRFSLSFFSFYFTGIDDTSPDKRNKLWKLVMDVISEQIKKGIDKDELEALFSQVEFGQNEQKDIFRGRSLCQTALNFSILGGDPADFFNNKEMFRRLREKIYDGSRYFEDIMKEIFIDCHHTASVCLVPSKTLGKEIADKERQKCLEAQVHWSEEDRQRILEGIDELKAFQEQDSDEKIKDVLPKLTREDIDSKFPDVKVKTDTVCGRPLLRSLHDTNGIVYGSVIFNVDDLTADELSIAKCVCELVSSVATEKHTKAEILRIQTRDLGSFSTSIGHSRVYGTDNQDNHRTVFKFHFSVLESKLDSLLSYFTELINFAKYDDETEIKVKIKSTISNYEDGLKSHGEGWALYRLRAMTSEGSYIEEILSGFERLKWLRRTLDTVNEKGTAELSAEILQMAKKIFVRSRMSLSISGNASDEWLEKLCLAVPEGPAPGPKAVIGKLEKRREGIEIPSRVGYAAIGARCPSDYCYSGKTVVANKIIYAYLWDEIRTKGGAYGCGGLISRSTFAEFSSHRDPDCAATLDRFCGTADYLRCVADKNDFENLVVSAYGDCSPMHTPKGLVWENESLWIQNLPFNNSEIICRELLNTTPDDLRQAADAIEAVCADPAVCVVGGHDILAACGDKLDVIISWTDK